MAAGIGGEDATSSADGRRPPLWVVVGAAGLTATAVFFMLPDGSLAQAIPFLGVLFLSATLLITRVVRHREEIPQFTWAALVGGVVVYTLATTLWYVLPVGLGIIPPFPSGIDGLFLLAYILYGVFLIRVIHSRQQSGDVDERRLALLDAGIIALAIGVVVWETLISPIVRSGGLSVAEQVAATAYPVSVGLLLAIVARLLVRGFRWNVSDLLLVAWVAGELGADVLYGVTSALGTFTYGHPMLLGWLLSYTALAALACHPHLWRLTTPDRTDASIKPHRVTPLVLAALIPLAVAVPGSSKPGYLAVAALSLTLVFVRIKFLSGDLTEQRRLATELIALSDEMRHRALHDSLTGLGNRALLMERLTHALERRPPRPGVTAALLLLDLDGFKGINDTLGHDVGDRMLIEVSSRLSDIVRPDDTVVRLGGDEFAVVLGEVDTEQALRVTRRILTRLQAPVVIDGQSLPMRASIGVRMADPDCSAGTGLRDADLAMYAAKGGGGNRYELFDAELHADFMARHRMELSLTGAASRGEMRLHYQPIMDLMTGSVCGVEALVRWEHPDQGLLYPGDFIALAETSGAIVGIGDWVVAEACRQRQQWARQGDLPEDFHIAVNLSRRELIEPVVVARLLGTVERGGCAPSDIILEVTETALMADTDELTSRLTQLRHHGFQIAMDDFGIGYSSLDQLRHLPIDILKIDRAFVAGITEGREDFALATAIVKLATSLGYRSLAEGVETPGQLAHLRALGVQEAQGYLFARPAPASEIQRMWARPVRSEESN